MPQRVKVVSGTTQQQPTGKRLIFPVLGKFRYGNDYGDPRGQGAHQGIDIMAPRKSLALAAEPGRVKFHITSSRAGACCTSTAQRDDLLIHLNNDLGMTNDNRGGCKLASRSRRA